MSEHVAISWREFWEHSGDHLYLGDRYLAAHYELVAQDILSLQPRPDAVVLDYGCGDALEAERVASRVALLNLYDPTTKVRNRLKRRFAQHPRITILDDATLSALPHSAIDLIIVNSVLQYLAVAEFVELLAQWRKLLKSSGMLVLADVIPPGNMIAKDIFALLAFAWSRGFLGAAVGWIDGSIFLGLSAFQTKVETDPLQ